MKETPFKSFLLFTLCFRSYVYSITSSPCVRTPEEIAASLKVFKSLPWNGDIFDGKFIGEKDEHEHDGVELLNKVLQAFFQGSEFGFEEGFFTNIPNNIDARGVYMSNTHYQLRKKAVGLYRDYLRNVIGDQWTAIWDKINKFVKDIRGRVGGAFPYRCFDRSEWEAFTTYVHFVYQLEKKYVFSNAGFLNRNVDMAWPGKCRGHDRFMYMGFVVYGKILFERASHFLELFGHNPQLGRMTERMRLDQNAALELQNRIVTTITDDAQFNFEEGSTFLERFTDFQGWDALYVYVKMYSEAKELLQIGDCTEDSFYCKMIDFMDVLTSAVEHMEAVLTTDQFCDRRSEWKWSVGWMIQSLWMLNKRATVNVLLDNEQLFGGGFGGAPWTADKGRNNHIFKTIFDDIVKNDLTRIRQIVGGPGGRAVLREALEKDCDVLKSIDIERRGERVVGDIPSCWIAYLLHKLEKFVALPDGSEDWKDAQAGIIITLLTTEAKHYIKLDSEEPLKHVQPYFNQIFHRIFAMATNMEHEKLKVLMEKIPTLHYITFKDGTDCTDTPLLTSNWRVSLSCLYSNLFRQLNGFVTAFLTPKDKIIYLNNDYKELLQRYREDALNADIIMELKNLEDSYINLSEQTIDKIGGKLDKSFEGLETYFDKLSKFDIGKSSIDVGYIHGKLTTYYIETKKEGKECETLLNEILFVLREVNLLEVAEETAQAACKAATACNPFNPDPGEALEAMAEVAAAVTELQISETIGELFTDAVKTTNNVYQNLTLNKDFIKKVYQIVDKLKMKVKDESEETFFKDEGHLTEEEFQSIVDDFMDEYNAYSPAVDEKEIEAMQTNWETFLEESCENIKDKETSAASARAKAFWKKGACFTSKAKISALMQRYRTIFQFQNELMETLAKVLRAYTSNFYAKGIHTNIVKAHREEERGNREKNKLDKLIRSSGKISFFLNYRTMLISIAGQYCNSLEYRNAGVMPQVCVTGMAKLRKVDVSKILGESISIKNRERTITVKIPEKNSTATGPFGFIDQDKLKRLKYGFSVPFRIPNMEYLVKHRWIDADWVREHALYVMRFRPHITIPDNPEIKFEVVASASKPLFPFAEDKGSTYALEPQVKYRFNYKRLDKEAGGCNSKQYNIEGTSQDIICQINSDEAEGSRNYDIKPSVFSEFSIKMKSPKLESLNGKELEGPMEVFLVVRAVSTNPYDKKKKKSAKRNQTGWITQSNSTLQSNSTFSE